MYTKYSVNLKVLETNIIFLYYAKYEIFHFNSFYQP